MRSIHFAALIAALVLATGCSPAGGGGRVRIDIFGLGFFPVVLASGGDSASLAFDSQRDLLVVTGLDAMLRLSRSDGSVEETDFSGDPDCAGASLLSVVAIGDVIYLGADDGRIFAFDELGDCSEIADLGDEAVTGLARAPRRFEFPAGTLIAAAGADGVFAVDVDFDGPPPVERISPDSTDAYIDVDFFQNLLFALDASNGQVVTLIFDDDTEAFEQATFVDDLAGAVGMAVDARNRELVLADAGEGMLRSISLVVEDGELLDLAPYSFDAAPPAGLAFDGTGTLVFATAGSVVLRAARVPPLAATSGALIQGPNVGYGDLEFDADGNLLLVANDEGFDGDEENEARPPQNFLFRLDRGGRDAVELAADIGSAGERLLSLARDPSSGALFMGSDLGNLFRRDTDGAITPLGGFASAVLGMEWAPPASEFAGQLVATTRDGAVAAIDPGNGAQTPLDDLGAILPDLVFDSAGTLYVLDFETPAVWRRPDGGAFALLASGPALGLPDGIAIDEGGQRLLVVSDVDPETDQLLEVTLAGAVRALVDVDIDDGFFPSGIVYDGLSRVALRAADNGSAVDVLVVPLPL